MRVKLVSLFPAEFISLLQAEGISTWRARQILRWFYSRSVFDPQEMSDIPKTLRAELMERFDFTLLEVIDRVGSRDKSVKFVLRTPDVSIIEMVVIPDGKKNTLCISSQVGCPHRCAFCATGSLPFRRNLQTGEINGQILLAASYLQPHKLTNLVFMGMGEPLDNLDNVLRTLQIIQSDDALSFSPRRTTISTCGIVPAIRTLADSGIKTKLAVSLNSAIDAVRDRLMPINRRYPLRELKDAIDYFRRKTSYRVTIEYIMIPGINMDDQNIRALRRFAGDLSVKINLIPFNPVAHQTWRTPSASEVAAFQTRLLDLKCAVILRKSRGTDIAGACGQLAGQLQQT
ncbi:MAG: 23S rRNA (adenine(2503)-C(2))-methyltransferase RlmN [Candidatus Cloacimonetes bacterium]|nr:23S rRNA (adenine(2503)-C(2))-methyltransferase RlmN [Candidatus Cloacimonadota bacterium]